MADPLESGLDQEAAPGFQVVPDAVAVTCKAFLALTARIGREQHAARLEARVQLPQHPRQLLNRHVKQGGVRKDTVEATRRQLERQKILLQDLATGARARRSHERGATVQPDRLVTEAAKVRQVPPRPAPEVEQGVGSRAFQVVKQRGVVLGDVVTLGARPEFVGRLLVIGERACDQPLKVLGAERLCVFPMAHDLYRLASWMSLASPRLASLARPLGSTSADRAPASSLYSATPFSLRIFHTFSGVIGMSMCRTPRWANASTTALAMAGGAPTVADSPTPFAPSG